MHGLDVESDVKLPAPEVYDHDVGIDLIVRIDRQEPPVCGTTYRRVDDQLDPWITERWIGDQIFVELANAGVFEIAEREIIVRRCDTDDLGLIAHRILDHVIPCVVGLRGDLMLHASGVVTSAGTGHLFVGVSGAGKSTLASGLACRGWKLLGDDGIRIVLDGATPVAVPAHPGVRLYPDVAEAVADGATSRGAMARGFTKHRFELPDGVAATARAPVRSIFLLEQDCDERPERISVAAAMSRLAPHTFHMARDPKNLSRAAFEALAGCGRRASEFVSARRGL